MTKSNLSRSAAEVIASTIVRSGAEHRGKGLTPSAREAAIAKAIEPVIADAVRQASNDAELAGANAALSAALIEAASLRARLVKAESAREKFRLRMDACEFAMVLMQGQIRHFQQEREGRQANAAFGGDSVAIAG